MDNRFNPPSPSAPPISYPWLNPKYANVPQELATDLAAGENEIVKAGMQNHEARVCLILDVSASMQNPNQFFDDPYKGNQVQRLINKALALAFLFDDNQQIEVFPFGDKVYPQVILDRNNFNNAADLIMNSIGGQFKLSTNYADPVKAIRRYYFCDSGERVRPQACKEPPVFALFITDGEPNANKIEAMNEFQSASHQAIFFKFIALKGQQKDLTFSYLSNIDNHSVKEYDNQPGFFIDNSDLVVLDSPDDLTMEKLIHEYRPWLIEAHNRKILANNPGIKLMEFSEEGRVTGSDKNRLFQPANKTHRNKNEDPNPVCCVIL